MVVLSSEREDGLNINLKNKRTERRLTQAQVAAKVGITTVGYQRYESGERVPNAHTAIQIADILGVKSYKQFKQLFSARALDNKPDGNPGKDDKRSE